MKDKKEICNEIAKLQPPPQHKQIFFPQGQKSQTLVQLHSWGGIICIATRKISMHLVGFLQIYIYAYKVINVLMDSSKHQVKENDILWTDDLKLVRP